MVGDGAEHRCAERDACERQRRRVFEPFYSGRERGSGLGLAITQWVIREAGGRIGFDSAPGRGTTFTIRIPATETDRRRFRGETA